jgi:general secretion pathway protein D
MRKLKQINTLLLVGVITLLQGCETLGPTLTPKRAIHDLSEISQLKAKPEIATSKATAVTSESNQRAPEIYKGSGVFINAAKDSPVSTVESEGSYTLNFNSVELPEVIKVILGDTLKYNFSISPKVVGKVSLHTAKPLTKVELLPTLEILLGMHKAVLVKDGSFYRVEPQDVVLSGGNIPLLSNAAAQAKGFQIQVIPLQYIGVQDMKKVLGPILPKHAILQIDLNRNLLFITGSPAELANTLELVNLFDIDIMQGKSVGFFPLTYVDAKTIEKELAQIFGSEVDNPLSGMLRMIPIERMNALMVISPQMKYLTRTEQWIKRLDRSGPQGQVGSVHVYEVQNVDAVELAAILEQVYPANNSSRGKSSRRGSVAPGLKQAIISSKDHTNNAPATKSQRNSAVIKQTGISNEISGPIRIIPDDVNNALVVVASNQDYESIKKLIKKLDVTPLQVLIDATIIEVSLTDELHYGLQWFFTNKASKGSGRVGDANFSAAGAGGFSYSLVNSSGIVRAELNALANDSRVNVLSAPSLMVLNNQEATIKVGDQVPIRTSESANTNSNVGDSALITSTIQMRDTGVTLTVKPRVNAGGLVIMGIEQNVDGVSRTASSEIDSPTIQQRQIKSSVAVQSGETIVLGGLITEQRERGQSGVPVLSRLPIVGDLFGKTDKVLNRTELVILLTPRVVKNQQDARLITREFKNKLTGIYKQAEEPSR